MNKEKTSAILSVAYLPPISYFYALLNYDQIFVEQYETYPKQTFRNRCQILSANGNLALTIPVNKPDGNHTKTRDVNIFNGERWQLNHWRAIKSVYLSSPFFLYFKDEIKDFYFQDQNNLLDFNLEIIKILMRIIGIVKDINLTQDYHHKPEDMVDLRNSINSKKPLKTELFSPYTQVFSDRQDFQANLSIIDLLFNLGPDTINYLANLDLEEQLERL